MVLLLLLLLLWLLAVPKDAMLVIPPLELLLLVVVLVGGVIVAALLLLLFDIGERPWEAEDAGAGGMTEGADWPATADGGAGGRKGGLGQDGAPRLARRDIGSSEAPGRAPAAELFRKELGG